MFHFSITVDSGEKKEDLFEIIMHVKDLMTESGFHFFVRSDISLAFTHCKKF